MDEVWKPIGVHNGIDYTGMYEVSNIGRVRSIDRHFVNANGVISYCKGKILSTFVTCQYERVGLSKNGKLKHISVHRLVAEAFVDNPYDYSEVNHIDENKLNNCADNLEWCSRKYNQKYYADRHPKQRKVEHRYCSVCGGKLNLGTKGIICIECITKSRKKNLINSQNAKNLHDRQQLKNLIRDNSFEDVGRLFSVSGNSIRKWCKKLNLPYKTSDIKRYSDADWESV